MSSKSKTIPNEHVGHALQIGHEVVSFGRNVVLKQGSAFKLQHRLFVNDPWELIAEAIARAPVDSKTKDIAQSFRRQAEDYFTAATLGSELAVRPVLLYYAFLNLAKAYGISKGNSRLASRAYHGIAFPQPKHRAITGSLVRFDSRKTPAIFHELLQQLGGNPQLTTAPLPLGHLLPQILPGHRLWCYATTRRTERFVTVEQLRILHSPQNKQIWLKLFVNRDDLEQIGLSEETLITRAGMASAFEHLPGINVLHPGLVTFQQKVPLTYISDPGDALIQLIRNARNLIWETVKIVSPYRKFYLYCCPSKEHDSRMPQTLSIYLLMFVLGSITRYFPGHFEELMESKYGPFFKTFISESPMQFLYLMASEILGQEVSKPAII